MGIKDILLVLSAREDNIPSLKYAVNMAAKHGAHLRTLCIIPSAQCTSHESYAIGAQADFSVIRRLRAEDRTVAEAIEAVVSEATRGNIDGSEFCSVGEVSAETTIVDAANLSDLTILSGSIAKGVNSHLIASVLLNTGSACIIVPTEALTSLAAARVVIAWNGSPEARTALVRGLPIMESAATVTIVSVDGFSIGQNGDASACQGRLMRHNVPTDIVYLRQNGRHAAGAILEYCAKSGADLLIMGAFGKSHIRRALLGGTTSMVLANAQIPILLSH